jgi:hypothetical protein
MHRQATLIALIVGSTALTLGTPAPLRAEGTQGSASPAPAGAGPYIKRQGPPKEIKHELLKAVPTDLKIPLPPDARFSAGYRSQYYPRRTTTELRFNTGNSPAAIADWYQKSLSAVGWTASTDKGSVQRRELYAFRQGTTCSMTFRALSPAATSVILTYCEAR